MKIFGKYLYISNVKFTMKGCPENFVIFWYFSVHDMNHMWFEFRSSPTTPSWFFRGKIQKYTQYLTVLTNKNIWHKIWLILHHPKKFEHHWIKNGPAVRFYFWTLFANLNFLNFIACAIVQCVGERSPFSEIISWNFLFYRNQISNILYSDKNTFIWLPQLVKVGLLYSGKNPPQSSFKVTEKNIPVLVSSKSLSP